ncbi:hypothetical protein [Domibacillus aminovorans]|nr:hypothetical protein [Domibacillus aminovorans]
MELFKLSAVQQNMLIASIMGDGEITKLYPGSRRINNSYREHYGVDYQEYREWKQSYFPDMLYLTLKSQTLRSKSSLLFTDLYPHFYNDRGQKCIPKRLLPLCTLPHFLAVLYMDDGTLSITKTINHRKRKIYLTPSIQLALQNFPRDQLDILIEHCQKIFGFSFRYFAVSNGHNFMIKLTTVESILSFLKLIKPVTITCKRMYYKTNWEWRFSLEKKMIQTAYPDYEVLASSSDRTKPYSQDEMTNLIALVQKGHTSLEIAAILGRSYHSVGYKKTDLRKKGLL